jgi:hypothetical protein
MKKNQLIKKIKVFLPFLTFVVLLFVFVSWGISGTKDIKGPNLVMAAEIDNISGYAWSDNIGWISFNCADVDSCGTSNYGVGIGTDNKLSGYAWSDNIGWVTFNESELGGCPEGDCKAKFVGNQLVGWARALAGKDASDDWDGWISLSKQASETIDYGISLNETTSVFEGYAWGNEVAGWIQFNPVYGGTEFNGESPEIKSGTFVVEKTITGAQPYADWQTEHVVSCDLSSDTGYNTTDVCTGSACLDVNNFLINETVEDETEYTLTCYNNYGMSTTAINKPLEYFDLSAAPAKVIIDFVSGGATTTPSYIEVLPYNGFKGTVSFSADNLDTELPLSPGVDVSSASFSYPTLQYSQYSQFSSDLKSKLEIFAAYRFTGEKNVTISGNSLGEPTELVVVIIDAGNVEPIYEEI